MHGNTVLYITTLLFLTVCNGVFAKYYQKRRSMIPHLANRQTDNNLQSFLLIRGGKTKKESILSIRYWTKSIGALFKGFFSKKNKITKSVDKKSSKSTSDSNKSAKQSSKTKSTTTKLSNTSNLIRIQKELQEFLSHPPALCKVDVGSNIRQWVVTITGPEGTIYAGESYKLQFKFPKDYPSKPPIVYFLKPTPKHVHVYTNGDICLNLIGKDWRPQMTAESIAISILSMLSSAKEKKLPPDNAMHSENPPGQQDLHWMYHDDKC